MIFLFVLFITKDTAAPSKLFQSNCKTQSEILFNPILRVEVTLLIFFSDAREFSASIAKNSNITFENVCFEYVQGKKILDQLSFTVPAGKRVAVVGGSGSGKSTLIRLLYRFFEPNNGAVKIGDENICDIDVECLRKEIAVVPQDSVLFHNTIKHNINYGNLNANEDDVILAAKMAEIHDSIQVKHKL